MPSTVLQKDKISEHNWLTYQVLKTVNFLVEISLSTHASFDIGIAKVRRTIGIKRLTIKGILVGRRKEDYL